MSIKDVRMVMQHSFTCAAALRDDQVKLCYMTMRTSLIDSTFLACIFLPGLPCVL